MVSEFTVGDLSGSGIQGDLTKAVHLQGLDPAGLAVPDPAHPALAETGRYRDASQRGLDVVAEPLRAGDQLDELTGFDGGTHGAAGLGRSSHARG